MHCIKHTSNSGLYYYVLLITVNICINFNDNIDMLRELHNYILDFTLLMANHFS